MDRSAGEYDFETKARLNAFVIREVAERLHPDLVGHELSAVQNNVAINMLSSADVHRLVGQLAEAIKREVDKQKSMLPEGKETVAFRVARRLSCSL